MGAGRPAPRAAARALGDLVQDVVITGHERDDVGALVFPNRGRLPRACAAARRWMRRACDLRHPAVRQRFIDAARRVQRAQHRQFDLVSAGDCCSTTPPSFDAREITDKGSINQRAVLGRRAALVDAALRSRRRRASSSTMESTRDDRRRTIDPTNLTAIDVHVHLEAPTSGNAADEAATKYFGDSGAPRDGAGARRLLPVAQDGLRASSPSTSA